MSKSIVSEFEETYSRCVKECGEFFDDYLLDTSDDLEIFKTHIRSLIERMDECIENANRVEESKREEFIGECKEFQKKVEGQIGLYDDDDDEAREHRREIESIEGKMDNIYSDVIYGGTKKNDVEIKKELSKLITLGGRCHELIGKYRAIANRIEFADMNHYDTVEIPFFRQLEEQYGFTTEGLFMDKPEDVTNLPGDEWYDASAKGWHC